MLAPQPPEQMVNVMKLIPTRLSDAQLLQPLISDTKIEILQDYEHSLRKCISKYEHSLGKCISKYENSLEKVHQ